MLGRGRKRRSPASRASERLISIRGSALSLHLCIHVGETYSVYDHGREDRGGHCGAILWVTFSAGEGVVVGLCVVHVQSAVSCVLMAGVVL